LAQTCVLLSAALPRKSLTSGEAIDLVRRTQRNNHKAKLSHSRRRKRRG